MDTRVTTIPSGRGNHHQNGKGNHGVGYACNAQFLTKDFFFSLRNTVQEIHVYIRYTLTPMNTYRYATNHIYKSQTFAMCISIVGEDH